MNIGLLAVLLPTPSGGTAASPQGGAGDMLGGNPFKEIMTRATQALQGEQIVPASDMAAQGSALTTQARLDAIATAQIQVPNLPLLTPDQVSLLAMDETGQPVTLTAEALAQLLATSEKMVPVPTDAAQVPQGGQGGDTMQAYLAILTGQTTQPVETDAGEIIADDGAQAQPVLLIMVAPKTPVQTAGDEPVDTLPPTTPLVTVDESGAIAVADVLTVDPQEMTDAAPLYAEFSMTPQQAETQVKIQASAALILVAANDNGWVEDTQALPVIRLVPAAAAADDGVADPAIWQQALQQTMGMTTGNVPADELPDADLTAGDLPDQELEAVIERLLAQRVNPDETAPHARAKEPLAFQAAAPHLVAQPAMPALNEPAVMLVDADGAAVDPLIDGTQIQQNGASHPSVQAGSNSQGQFVKLAAEAQHMAQYTPAEQVRMTIRHAVETGLDRITLKLHPEDLGRVEIRIDMLADGRSQISFVADSRDTMDMLQRDARALERALQEAGMDASASDMEFTLARQDQQDGWGDRDEQGNPAYGALPEADIVPEAGVDPVTGNYTLTVNGGVDIRV